jgi:hypothetical protein
MKYDFVRRNKTFGDAGVKNLNLLFNLSRYMPKYGINLFRIRKRKIEGHRNIMLSESSFSARIGALSSDKPAFSGE